ncbi:MAG: protein-glutamate O-methyltransferase CheR [Polyangiales bacterium]
MGRSRDRGGLSVGASGDPEEVQSFRAAIKRALGLNVDEKRAEILAEILARRAASRGVTADAYLRDLTAGGAAHPEWRALAPELTIGETYFFRHMDQLRAFAEVALPTRVRARRSERALRVLSAGCSSGEEPYSLAILVREAALGPGWDVSIRALDLNPAALQRAARGRYLHWALRETPEATRRRWFSGEGREAVLDPAIRAAVRFEEHNLASDDSALGPPGTYDVIFCRNVLMYFAPERARAVVARFAAALAPGGYLFLGHAENLRGLSQDFDLCSARGTFFYQRRGGADASSEPPAPTPDRPSAPAPALDLEPHWFDAIRAASERIRALSDAPSAAGAAKDERAVVDLRPALALLERERYDEALAALPARAVGAADDEDAMLLRAALLVHGGRACDAEVIAREILARDARNAGARYVIALGREGAGDAAGAAAQHREAAALDPTFSMPRLHLGLMARRAGDRGAALRDLDEALRLLRSEDPFRLLLFGGGFNREGLVALCRSEIARLGGSR